MDNAELIDSFKSKFGFQHDTDVAFVLQVPKWQLGDWKAERKPMPVPVKFRLLDHIHDETRFPEVILYASMFVDMNEHENAMQEEKARIADRIESVLDANTNYRNIFQRVLEDGQFESYERLANLLGWDPLWVKDWLEGTNKEIGPLKRFQLMDTYGFVKIRNAITSVLPQDVQSKLIKGNNRISAKVVGAKKSKADAK